MLTAAVRCVFVLRRCVLVLPLILLAACASAPAPVLYTLMPEGTMTDPAPQPVRVLVQIAPVRVPEALDRTDVLLTHGSVQVQRLPHALWRSPYAEEVQDAVLAGILSNGKIARLPHLASQQQSPLPAFELRLAVDRMDMAPQRLARLDVTWAVRPLHTARPLQSSQRTGVALGRADNSKGQSAATGAADVSAISDAAGIICRARWHTPLADADIASAVAAQQQHIQRWARRIQRQLMQAAAPRGVLDCGAEVTDAPST